MKAKILIVDDEAFTCQDISQFLQMKGYETATANSAKEALSKFLSFSPDITLMDLRMPLMDGLDCLQEIKKLNKDALVVIVTCVTDLDIAKKALKLGATDYIVKPFDLDRLETAIMTYLFLKTEKYA